MQQRSLVDAVQFITILIIIYYSPASAVNQMWRKRKIKLQTECAGATKNCIMFISSEGQSLAGPNIRNRFGMSVLNVPRRTPRNVDAFPGGFLPWKRHRGFYHTLTQINVKIEILFKIHFWLIVDAFCSLFQEAQIEDMPTFDPGATFEGEWSSNIGNIEIPIFLLVQRRHPGPHCWRMWTVMRGHAIGQPRPSLAQWDRRISVL